MNAKKIMGAVLVALLAAALFVGAGAAADLDGKTVFVYQNVTGLNGTWANAAGNTITAIALDGDKAGYFAGDNIVEGTYSQGSGDKKVEIIVKYPTATVSGVATATGMQYAIIGGTLYKNANWANFTIESAADGVDLENLLITKPNGEVVNGIKFIADLGLDSKVITEAVYTKILDGTVVRNDLITVVPKYFNTSMFGNDADYITVSLNQTLVANLTTGTYKIQGLFTQQTTDKADQLLPSTPASLLAGKDVFTFTVASSSDVTLAANVESVLVGNIVTVTITGMPGETYNITGDFSVDSFGTVSGTPTPDDGIVANILMPNDGKAVIYMKCNSDGNKKINVELAGTKKASITVEVTKGSITAETDKESYFIGDAVTISGTSTAADKLVVYIKGTNVGIQSLGVEITVGNDDTWEEEITDLKAKKDGQDTAKILDAGTYTLYIIAKDDNVDVSELSKETYITVPLVLKQPFISVTDAPAVAVKETEYKVTGTAEATDDLAVYIFGTNFYAATNGTANVTKNVLISNPVSFDGNEFTIKFTIPAEGMAAGQYFMVIQHPMYDEKYNIYSDAAGNINLTNKGDKTDAKILFNVYERQTANAAQALCDALETEDIDDMYVKLSFVVAAPTSTINPIPTEITQGSKLTISGQTNMGKDKVVVVEMLSTAFAAVPKDTVGSAAFASVMTKTDADGNWEVTIDTTGLNVDEYTVSVAVADLDPTTAKINVIEGAPTEQPTENPTEQPTQTEQPTEAPATPGFGALAALAGLGAVAVLLLRRE